MGDQVKEFFSGELEYGDYTAGVKTLITTDGTTQAVITDIQVTAVSGTGGDGTSSTGGDIKIGDFSIISELEEGHYTGKEIVDINSTVTTTRNVETVVGGEVNSYFKFLSTDDSASARYLIGANEYFGIDRYGDLFPFTTVTEEEDFTIPALSSHYTQGYIVGDDFYYVTNDANSTHYLYKRTGGVTSTDNTVHGGGYTPKVFDGSLFYWVNTTNTLQVYDPSDGSFTSHTLTATNGTTYPGLVYCAGYLFWKNTYNSSSMQVYRTADMSYVGSFSAGSGAASSGANYTRSIYAVLSSDGLTIEVGCFSGAGKYYDIFTISSETFTTTGSSANVTVYPSTGTGGKCIRMSDCFTLVCNSNASITGVMEYGSTGTSVGAFMTDFDDAMVVEFSEAQYTETQEEADARVIAEFGSVTLRITGIETTL